MIWVLDASVALRWVLEDERDDSADAVLRLVLERPRLFAVPELFAFEVLAVLLRLHPRPLLAYRQAILPILQGGLLRLPMTDELLASCDRLAAAGLTGYDASYAGLAELLGGVWLTFDSRAHTRLAGRNLSWLLADGLPPLWPHSRS